jgi:hypothetical protein
MFMRIRNEENFDITYIFLVNFDPDDCNHSLRILKFRFFDNCHKICKFSFKNYVKGLRFAQFHQLQSQYRSSILYNLQSDHIFPDKNAYRMFTDRYRNRLFSIFKLWTIRGRDNPAGNLVPLRSIFNCLIKLLNKLN